MCTLGSSCNLTLDIPERMPAPVYFYYRLTNYYQNHRRYVKSRDDAQLRGEQRSFADVENTCNPVVSFNNSQAQGDVYFPCGLIAKSMFTDEFRFVDAAVNNLHVVGYSTPIHARMSLADLKPHLHTLPDQPDLIPYRTSYYNEDWGFCLPHTLLQSLPNDTYEIVIDKPII